MTPQSNCLHSSSTNTSTERQLTQVTMSLMLPIRFFQFASVESKTTKSMAIIDRTVPALCKKGECLNNDASSVTLWYNNNSQSIRKTEIWQNHLKPFIITGKLHLFRCLLFKRNGSLVLNGDRQILVITTSSAIYLSLDHAVFPSRVEVSKFLHIHQP